jgi:hypothetical protein
MSVGGIVLALLAFGLLLALLALPFVRARAAAAETPAERQRERLKRYYERVVRNLRDLDEDYALGKLDAAEYRAEREYLAERGVQALRALDALDAAVPGTEPRAVSPTDAELDTAIDAAIEQAVKHALAERRDAEPATPQTETV